MLKWILRTLVVLAVLLIAFAVIVQCILWSNLPSRIVLRQLQAETGLRITAGSLKTGWLGRTSLRDVTISLPLDSQPLAEIPSLEVRHTALPMILLLGDVQVQHAQMRDARFRIAQDETGVWNVWSAIETVRETARAAGRETAGMIALPEIDVRDAHVTLVNRRNESLALPPLAFEGRPDGAYVWNFAGTVPQVLQIDGRVATGGAWQHAVNFQLNASEELLRAFVDENVSSPLHAQGIWQGKLADEWLTGQLTLSDATFANVQSNGAVALEINGQGAIASAMNLHVQLPAQWNMPVEQIWLTGGQLALSHAMIELSQLQLGTQDIAMALDGCWDRRRNFGELAAQWEGRGQTDTITHYGALQATAQMPSAGLRSLNLISVSKGSAPIGSWDMQIEASAQGVNWTAMEGTLTLPRLIVKTDEDEIDLGGAVSRFQATWPEIRLTQLDVPNARAQASGRINVQTQQWSLNASASQWDVLGLPAAPIDLRLAASGDHTRAVISKFEIANHAWQLLAEGTYTLHAPQPLDSRAVITAALPAIKLDGSFVPDKDASSPASLRTEITVQGDVQPLTLFAQGDTVITNLKVGDGRIEQLTIPVNAALTPDATRWQVQINDLFSGQASVQGEYRPSTQTIIAHVDAVNVLVQQALDLVGAPIDAEGALAAQFTANIPNFDLTKAHLDGNWQLADARIRDERFTTAGGRISSSDGILRLEQMRLENDDASLAGNMQLHTATRRLTVDVTAESWPLASSEYNLRLIADGHADLDIDLVEKTAQGNVNVQGLASINGTELGPMQAVASVQGRTVHISQFNAAVLDGTVEGHGKLVIDQWTDSTGELMWSNLDMATVARFVPELAILRGTLSGAATIEKATAPHAPEPMRIDMVLHSDNIELQTITFGGGRIEAYAGPDRILIQKSQFDAVDGSLALWGRLTWHDDAPFVHWNVDFDQLSLNQILQITDPSDHEIPGRVTGQLSAGGYLQYPHRMFGEGRVRLRETDLANLPIISLLYNTLNLNFGRSDPTGEGTAIFRLEGDAIELSRLEYYNRGTDVLARLRIADIWAGAESPIDGVAVGAVRPLKDIDLPFFRDLDRTLGALQADTASVRISGTLGERDVRVVPFAEVSGTIGRLISGSSN